jgi:XTP/dITP diphosphohydrolase
VLSARYAGPARDPAANMRKLLGELQGTIDRRARFRTVIAFIDPTGEHLFEGEVAGTITTSPHGTGGFGYDPVFVPEMSELTFAELDPVKKNAISHRARAVWKLAMFLEEAYRDR